jgi:hypothetical protein
MTNVYGTPKKRATRKGLFAFGVQTLEREGWKVSRVPRGGKASLRLITKGSENHRVSIRTSQDAWIAFPRKTDGTGWVTLDDVDYVVAVSVDDRHNPTQARVHMIPGDDARARFDRAYGARRDASFVLPPGRGIWLSLYQQEAAEPVSLVGAGMGLTYKALAVLDLTKASLPTGRDRADDEVVDEEDEEVAAPVAAPETPLTIPEAKRRLAQTLKVPESAIRITIEH